MRGDIEYLVTKKCDMIDSEIVFTYGIDYREAVFESEEENDWKEIPGDKEHENLTTVIEKILSHNKSLGGTSAYLLTGALDKNNELEISFSQRGVNSCYMPLQNHEKVALYRGLVEKIGIKE